MFKLSINQAIKKMYNQMIQNLIQKKGKIKEKKKIV